MTPEREQEIRIIVAPNSRGVRDLLVELDAVRKELEQTRSAQIDKAITAPLFKQLKTSTSRLAEIAEIIEAVDRRCSAVDGPVSDTRAEMTAAEMRKIYQLAKGKKG